MGRCTLAVLLQQNLFAGFFIAGSCLGWNIRASPASPRQLLLISPLSSFFLLIPNFLIGNFDEGGEGGALVVLLLPPSQAHQTHTLMTSNTSRTWRGLRV